MHMDNVLISRLVESLADFDIFKGNAIFEKLQLISEKYSFSLFFERVAETFASLLNFFA